MKFNFFQQLSTEISSIIKGYPEFVFKNKPESLVNKIPVFVFHSIEPQTFEEQLIFLKENSIKTLSIDDYVDIIRGKIKLQGKSILLTVDDARISFWIYGYPLLKKYNMNATLFIIPGLTKHEMELHPKLDDYWNKRLSFEDVKVKDTLDETLCSWEELKNMYESGNIDIEIHTLFHKEVFTGTTIVDFINQETGFLPFNSSASPYLTLEDIGKGYQKEKLLGYPLFESVPLMKGINSFKVPDYILSKSKELYNEDPEGFETNRIVSMQARLHEAS